jgi:outer membrane receptor protein involved in Fe transport
VLGRTLQDTAYTQYGGRARVTFKPGLLDAVTVSYLRGEQDGARRYDQLDGGLGNLIAGYDPQTLDFALGRYERLAVGPFETVTTTVSFNAQRDDRSSQNVNNATQGLRSKITDETNSTRVLGWQGQATLSPVDRHRLSMGFEIYSERVQSRRLDRAFDATTGDFTDESVVRPRFPDGARYRSMAVFLQDTARLAGDWLTGTVGLRYSRFRYEQPSRPNDPSSGVPLVPGFGTSFGDMTWSTGVVAEIGPHLAVTGRVARGFRAPNVNDFGSIGLSGLGFEIDPDEAVRLAARSVRLGPLTDAHPVRQLVPEQATNVEGGVRVRSSRLTAAAAIFRTRLSDFIERQTVLLPPGAVGSSIGGQPIVGQDGSGAVYTALSNTAVFVRANAGHVRMSGWEANATLFLAEALSLRVALGSVRGTDLETGRPPAIENGIPPTSGFAGLRWDPAGRRWWGEVYSLFALAQTRFSANDLQQARTGGLRSRQEIVDFFNNGAVARGLVADGVLLATGETVDQVVLRVLGPDPDARLPLYTENPAFAVLGLRGGWRLSGRATLTVILENVFDHNYRTMGSGVDGPGVNLVLRQAVTF